MLQSCAERKPSIKPADTVHFELEGPPDGTWAAVWRDSLGGGGRRPWRARWRGEIYPHPCPLPGRERERYPEGGALTPSGSFRSRGPGVRRRYACGATGQGCSGRCEPAGKESDRLGLALRCGACGGGRPRPARGSTGSCGGPLLDHTANHTADHTADHAADHTANHPAKKPWPKRSIKNRVKQRRSAVCGLRCRPTRAEVQRRA